MDKEEVIINVEIFSMTLQILYKDRKRNKRHGGKLLGILD